MIGLLTMLFSTVGAAGAGSALKMIGGFIQAWMENRNIAAREKAGFALKERAHDIEFQKLVFGGNNADSQSALNTRRILAVIGVSTLSATTILSILYPGAELVTFTPPESRGDTSFLWGLITIKDQAAMVTRITTGHVAIMGVTSFSMILGFYFTPGGRK